MLYKDVRLLLVDDDPSAIRVMSRMLARYPDQRFATSGPEALRLARESTPDLIMLDADMPGMSGFEECDAMRADPVLSQIPVIFATSHDTTEVQVAALQQGAVDFMTKPLVASRLTARVRAHLRSRMLLEETKSGRELADDAAPRAGTSQPSILIVDDDVGAIQLLRNALCDVGSLYFAKSGEEAMELAHRHVPDLILLDAQIPGVNGFDVCKSLKSEPMFRHVPVVFVTRFSDPRNEMRALDLGAADFIAKPYTRAILLARVRNLLELKHRTFVELQGTRDHWRKVSDARIADIVAAASDAIITFDADDKIVLINGAACRMFGVERDDAIGSAMQHLLGEATAQRERWKLGPTRIVVTSTDGSSVPAEISSSRLGDGADHLTTIVLRDIGDRERLETESRARTAAETSSQTKTAMLSYIAHEMGNPLNGLLGFTQLMTLDTDHPLPVQQAQRLEHVMTSGMQLQTLLRDVLDVGRFETGNLAVETVELDAERCVEAAFVAAGALAELAGVTMSCSPLPERLGILADAGRLHQCLMNLMTNAIKYGRKGGQVRVEVRGVADQVAISIRDDGIGMEELQLRHLFEPFNRLGRQRSAAPGAGLGLVITRQLVEAMHGHLEVESQVETGSCFTMLLPRSLPAEDSTS